MNEGIVLGDAIYQIVVFLVLFSIIWAIFSIIRNSIKKKKHIENIDRKLDNLIEQIKKDK